VAIDISTDGFEIAEPLQAVGAALGTDPMTFILGGGDDHALVATYPSDAAVPQGWTVIGAVRAAEDEGPVVTVDGVAYDGPAGHQHFR
jgi:thiamine-monophosphate kinase